MDHESGLIYDGECRYDVENEHWVHTCKGDCTHKLPDDELPRFSEELIAPIRNRLNILKEASVAANQEILVIAEEMLKSNEEVRDISQYEKLWRYLSLPRQTYIDGGITLGIDNESHKVIICSRKHAIERLFSRDNNYAFESI